jgi:hypothetical protein
MELLDGAGIVVGGGANLHRLVHDWDRIPARHQAVRWGRAEFVIVADFKKRKVDPIDRVFRGSSLGRRVFVPNGWRLDFGNRGGAFIRIRGRLVPSPKAFQKPALLPFPGQPPKPDPSKHGKRQHQ